MTDEDLHVYSALRVQIRPDVRLPLELDWGYMWDRDEYVVLLDWGSPLVQKVAIPLSGMEVVA